MQLELLVPQTWTHPVKAFLHAWYTRMGYQRVRTGRLEEAYPALQPQLATPCDFAVYHKDLSSASPADRTSERIPLFSGPANSSMAPKCGIVSA